VTFGEKSVTTLVSFVTSKLRRHETFEYQNASGRNGPGRDFPSAPTIRLHNAEALPVWAPERDGKDLSVAIWY